MKSLHKNIIFRFLFLITTFVVQNKISAIDEQNVQTIVLHEILKKTDQLPLHKIILNQDYTTQEKIRLMRDILNDGMVNVNAQDSNGKTALNLITFYNGDPDLAQLLIISYKADVNKPDRFNISPLHNAIEKEEIEIAKMLLDAGADRYLKNDADEITPVDLARSPKTIALFDQKD